MVAAESTRAQSVRIDRLRVLLDMALLLSVPQGTTGDGRRLTDGFRSLHPGPTLEIVRMARRSHHRKTGYADSLASERLSIVLEMEVPIRRPSAGPRRCSAVDRRDGNE